MPLDAEFEESKHPRGQPGNAGQFGSAGGGKEVAERSASLEDVTLDPKMSKPMARLVGQALKYFDPKEVRGLILSEMSRGNIAGVHTAGSKKIGLSSEVKRPETLATILKHESIHSRQGGWMTTLEKEDEAYEKTAVWAEKNAKKFPANKELWEKLAKHQRESWVRARPLYAGKGDSVVVDEVIATDPPTNEKQRRAMYAALSGKSSLGIPRSVAVKFVGNGHDAEFEESKHPRDHGKFTTNAGAASGGGAVSSTPPKKRPVYNGGSLGPSDISKAEKAINDRVQKLEEAGEDNPDNHEFAALSHIATVFDNLQNAKLSEKQYQKAAIVLDDNGAPLAAGLLKLTRDKRSAEITNVGSLERGHGAPVIKSLLAQAKQSGAKEVRLQSTSREFYERLGFEQRSDGYMHRKILASDAALSARDMSKFDWRAIRDGLRALFKFVDEEEREPEHAEDGPEPHGAGVIFIEPNGRVLFLKRSTSSDHVGEWCFPGGTIDPGEIPAEAARREAIEEAGRDPGALQQHVDDRDGFITFICPVDEQFVAKLDDDSTDHVWAPADDPPQPLHPGVAATLETLGSQLEDAENEATDAALQRAPDGSWRTAAELGEILPVTTRHLRESGELEAAQRHPGPRYNGGEAADAVEHDPKSGQFTSVGEVAEHHGYKKSGAKTYSLAKAGKNWSAKAGHRVTETYTHPDTKHSITVQGPSWKHNFYKSGGNSKSGAGFAELHEHLTERKRRTASDAYLAQDPTYPVKTQAQDGTWHYSAPLLRVAARKARVRGRTDIARRAEAILASDQMTYGSGQFIEPPPKSETPDPNAPKARDEEDDAKMAADRALALDWCAAVGIERVPTEVVIALDRDSVRRRDIDGRLHVEESNLTRATVSPYRGNEIPDWRKHGLDPDRIYNLLRDPKELAKPDTVASFNRIPILEEHRPISSDDHPHSIVIGTTGDRAVWDPPFIKNSLTVWTKGAIDAIESNKKRDLSAGYRYTFVPDNGEYEGQRYQGKMTAIIANHIASVVDGRVPGSFVGDSKL